MTMININMRCIEMIHTYVNLRNCPLININMRCIEISVQCTSVGSKNAD